MDKTLKLPNSSASKLAELKIEASKMEATKIFEPKQNNRKIINQKPSLSAEIKPEQNKKFSKPQSKPFNAKTGSRFVAVQALYSLAVDSTQSEKDSLINASELFKEKFSKRINFNFAGELLEKSISEKQSIEFIFKNYLDKLKEIELVNPLVRAIVTVAICEILINSSTNKKVIISEYVKIASSFFNKKEVGFVNALLDKFVKENQ